MWPYWLMFVVSSLGVLGPARLDPGARRAAWLVAAVVFTLAIGLRHEVGGDWFAYLAHLHRLDGESSPAVLTGGDPGYYLLNWVVAQLGGTIYWVNLACGAILMSGVIVFARNQPFPWLALLVAVPYLIIVVGMGYTRQAAALGFVLLGLTALSHQQIRRFVVWVVLGTLFHKSAVLILPVAALAASRRRLWTMIWVGVIAVLTAYFFVFEAADRLWENYVVADYHSQGGFIRVLMNAVPAVLFFTLGRYLRLGEGERRLWRWMSLLALACVPLVLISSTATDRVALYLIPLQLFVFSRLHLITHSPSGRGVIVLGWCCTTPWWSSSG
ncbi:MAG: EpsG family protein [Arhodomonas sp.]|nr:EpsG family protein [Arhodomonas sp.]